VVFLPFQDRDELNDSLNVADVHLVSQLPAFTGIVVPSKLAGILAVGKPTIMIGPGESECALIVRESAAGFVVPNGDPGLLLSRIQLLRDNAESRVEIGRRARSTFEAAYDRPVACARIEAVLRCVTERNGRQTPAEC
jgi:glycosyltransferase involved in cell wall biosynthesis